MDQANLNETNKRALPQELTIGLSLVASGESQQSASDHLRGVQVTDALEENSSTASVTAVKTQITPIVSSSTEVTDAPTTDAPTTMIIPAEQLDAGVPVSELSKPAVTNSGGFSKTVLIVTILTVLFAIATAVSFYLFYKPEEKKTAEEKAAEEKKIAEEKAAEEKAAEVKAAEVKAAEVKAAEEKAAEEKAAVVKAAQEEALRQAAAQKVELTPEELKRKTFDDLNQSYIDTLTQDRLNFTKNMDLVRKPSAAVYDALASYLDASSPTGNLKDSDKLTDSTLKQEVQDWIAAVNDAMNPVILTKLFKDLENYIDLMEKNKIGDDLVIQNPDRVTTGYSYIKWFGSWEYTNIDTQYIYDYFKETRILRMILEAHARLFKIRQVNEELKSLDGEWKKRMADNRSYFNVPGNVAAMLKGRGPPSQWFKNKFKAIRDSMKAKNLSEQVTAHIKDSVCPTKHPMETGIGTIKGTALKNFDEGIAFFVKKGDHDDVFVAPYQRYVHLCLRLQGRSAGKPLNLKNDEKIPYGASFDYFDFDKDFTIVRGNDENRAYFNEIPRLNGLIMESKASLDFILPEDLKGGNGASAAGKEDKKDQ